jgi:homoserine kinase
LYVSLIHPHLHLDTRKSRAVLKHQVDLDVFIKQNMRLAAWITSLYEKDYERFANACQDELIEPMRAHLIPGFYDVKAIAYRFGALACSISGSGPTLFAMAKTKDTAESIAMHMRQEFEKHGIQSDALITTIASQGARVIDEH